jgi:hypothetical protein
MSVPLRASAAAADNSSEEPFRCGRLVLRFEVWLFLSQWIYGLTVQT